MRLGDHQMELFGGHMILRFAGNPDQREDARAGAVEQPHERRGRLGQPAHRDRHRHRDWLGTAQRELLGDELARDQADEGRQDDDEAEPEPVGAVMAQPEQFESLGDGFAQPRP